MLQQLKNLNFCYFSHFSICINFKTFFMHQVKSESEKLFEIKDIQEKLETLCSRINHLENLSSRNNKKNVDLQFVTTEQQGDVANRHQVYTVNLFGIFFGIENILQCTYWHAAPNIVVFVRLPKVNHNIELISIEQVR